MPNKSVITLLAAGTLVGAGAVGGIVIDGDEPCRQEVVAQRGAQVMPFSLEATTHVFDATDQGGTQRVVAKDPDDSEQIRLIREHLREEAHAFGRGEFADPATIHGDDMPGLDTLVTGYRDIDVRYRDLREGAEIAYRTDDPELAAAVGAWFDAQLRDHAGDAATSAASGPDHTSHTDHED